ncbi:hypothetical protein [Sagittula sp. S175]|uniref:hypothetical protein n=1 Tax=Sagittula sp. S175 TaxID=3415129 RepID=UPI003C7AECDF
MKTLIASTLAATVALSGAAFAGSIQLDPSAYGYVSTLDAASLSDTQVAAINAVLGTSDSDLEITSQINAIAR